MTTHYTYKGRPVDMAAMMMMNEHAVAMGNASMNARGDILGRSGRIMKTAEMIAHDEAIAAEQHAMLTNEDYAIEQPPMEQFDESLLTGYDEPADDEAE